MRSQEPGKTITPSPGMLSRSHGTPGLGLTPNHGSSFAFSHILWGSGQHKGLGEGNPQVFWELRCVCDAGKAHPSSLRMLIPPARCFVQLFGNAWLSSSGIPCASHPEHKALFPLITALEIPAGSLHSQRDVGTLEFAGILWDPQRQP